MLLSYYVAPRQYLSVEEVKPKIKTATNFRRQQKWLIIYNALVDPLPTLEIALPTGTTKRTVHQVIFVQRNREHLDQIYELAFDNVSQLSPLPVLRQGFQPMPVQ